MKPPGNFGSVWTRFWFSQASTVALGIFRILFGLVLLAEISSTGARSRFAVVGGFHLPYVPFVGPVSEPLYELIHWLQYPLVVLFVLGLWFRFSCVSLLVLQGFVFFSDQLNFRNHPYFFLLLLVILLYSRAGDALSVRAVIRAFRTGGREALLGSSHFLMSQRLIQVQVCIVYVFAALHKMHGAYFRGEVLGGLMASNVMAGDSGSVLRSLFSDATLMRVQDWIERPMVFVVPAILTVSIELIVPFALWFRRTRWPAIIVGTLFHLWVAFSMSIWIFSSTMIASYVLFLEPKAVRDFVRRLLGLGKAASIAVDTTSIAVNTR